MRIYIGLSFISLFLTTVSGSCTSGGSSNGTGYSMQTENDSNVSINTIESVSGKQVIDRENSLETNELATIAKSENLLRNPGFEEGNSSWDNNLKVDYKTKRTGKASAYYNGVGSSKNKVFTQELSKVEPGQVIEFSGWIKGQNISTQDLNAEKGAAIFVQGYSSIGKYIKGAFSVALTGSFDWRFVRGYYIVPDGVSNIKFGLFLRPKSVGSVWFDDLNVQIVNSDNLSIGPNTLSATASTFTSESKVTYIDSDGFTVKNGKRIFPLILYIGEGPKKGNWANSDANLDRISKAGFNSIMSYYYGDRPDINEFFQSARKYKLDVLFNLKDIHDGLQTYKTIKSPASDVAAGIVKKFSNEPNLLGWYINDELGISKYSSIETLFSTVLENDGKHLTYQVENSVNELKYLKGLSDVIGTDPYPVNKKTMNTLGLVSNWTKSTVNIAGNNRGVWQVIQLVDLSFHNKKDARAPNLNEIRNMAYQAIISGAKGLSFYNYHWLWYGFDANRKKVYSEIAFNRRWKDVEILLNELSGISGVILNNQIIELSSIGNNPGIYYRCYEHGDNIVVIIANPDNSTHQMLLEVPAGYEIDSKSLSEKSKLRLTENKLQIDASGFESGSIKLSKSRI